MRPIRFELRIVDLPLKHPFRHAAAVRTHSASLFLKCLTDQGSVGFGETLPREYVTQETCESAFDLLKTAVLPNLLTKQFSSLRDVKEFLRECDGKAPAPWVAPETPQSAAWAAVDLSLLDAFGHAFGESVRLDPHQGLPSGFRYSAVVSSDNRVRLLVTLLKIRLFGFPQVKIKVGGDHDLNVVRLGRWILGTKCDIRVDANMAWEKGNAFQRMQALKKFGVTSFEQPCRVEDLSTMAELVGRHKFPVMADESLTDRVSLTTLVKQQACTAVNVRVAKCGGLMAAYTRCREARQAGLQLQIGCQVGESSLLSAANLILISGIREVGYGEGCFGKLLLREDPASPCLQFGYAGRPPQLLQGPGLGPRVSEETLTRWTRRYEIVE